MQFLRKYSSKLQFVVGATIVGNMLEWFDFALFGMMAPLFATLFFSKEDASVDLPFLFFALSAAARPIGGIVFGYMGDRLGRKTALLRTIVLMTIPIFLIGILPSYVQIGGAATVFLAIFCFFQGFCMGGEFPGSVVFLVESSPPKLRGYIGSWAYFGVLFGMCLGAVDIYILNQSLSASDFKAWGWRLPFFFGAILGLIGIFLRRLLHETPLFQEAKTASQLVNKPFTASLQKHKKELLQGLGIMVADAVGFNLIIVFCTSYFIHHLHLSAKLSFLLNAYTVIVGMLAIPLAGKLSSRIGPVRLIQMALAALFFGALPLYLLIASGTIFWIFIGQGLLVALLASYLCNLPAIICKLFPTEVRYSCCALIINFSVAIFGGTTPLLINYLLDKTEWHFMPALYLMVAAVISFYSLKKSKISSV
jgi:MHS family proline/betaine transporter-like MFS transporter